MFLNNTSLCNCVTETDVKRIFYMASASSNPEHLELTVILRTIIEVNY